jgi:dipeptidyl-peptidase-4
MIIDFPWNFQTNQQNKLKQAMRNILNILALFIVVSISAFGQDRITLEDYERAISFQNGNIVNKQVFNLNIQANWFPDSTGLWYLKHGVDSKEYLKISLPDLNQADLFDHQKVAERFSDLLEEPIKANELPISRIEYKNTNELILSLKGKQYILNTSTYTLEEHKPEISSNRREVTSPDKQWTAYSKDYNLFIKSTTNEAVKQLSTSGTKGYEYASWYGWADIIQGENGERPENFSVNWSENSEWIAANICDLRTARKMYLLDWSIDSLYRPNLLSYYRGSPGDTDIIYMEPVFFNVHTGQEIKPDLPRSTHINSVSFRWSETPGKVFLERSSRGYQNLNIYTFDLKTEDLQSIYSETSKTNIDNFQYRLVEKSNRLFFLSEKSGWRQLYSLDLTTKKEQAITGGAYFINDIVNIDEAAQKIYFLASGKEKGRNPYYQHLYSVSFDGKDLRLLTPENYNHVISLAPDGRYFVDNFSTVNQATTTVLRSAENGAILQEISRATLTDLVGWNPPQIFTTTARDGKTPIYGAIWKPTNFDSTRRYPILEYSYTGPHTQVFPREFSRAFGFQSYAELGFVVIAVDGLGSSGRSKAFHDYSYKNLGGNLEDHVLAIRELGRRHQWLDTTRVGIFGHSAGGYDAGHAVLAYPDFYKVAVASSADHDHRMEKAWWPEMYMGWPVDSAYHLQSNITMAGNLKGKLLITHGGIDDNVNPSATFKLAEALIKADKQFDMLILPSQQHGYRGQHSRYFQKTRWNYFIKHLRGVEPIWDFKWE